MTNAREKRLPSVLSGLLLAAALMPAAHALEVGDPAPQIELAGRSGQMVRVDKHPGRILYVDFWASWCGPCRQSFPWMNAMQEKYKGSGFQVIGINLDAQAEDAESFLSKLPARFPIAYDPKGASARLYGVKGMPTSLLIGKDGKVLYQHMGFNNEGREKLEQAIQAALGSAK